MVKILVAEDDDIQRHLVVSSLRDRQHEVHEALDGVQALAVFKTEKPHLVITDIEMPIQNGHWLIAEIRKLDVLMPIIAMSGGSLEKLQHAKVLGADVCMEKPFLYAEFLDTISDLVSKSGVVQL